MRSIFDAAKHRSLASQIENPITSLAIRGSSDTLLSLIAIARIVSWNPTSLSFEWITIYGSDAAGVFAWKVQCSGCLLSFCVDSIVIEETQETVCNRIHNGDLHELSQQVTCQDCQTCNVRKL
eukprot:s5207_g2.t1